MEKKVKKVKKDKAKLSINSANLKVGELIKVDGSMYRVTKLSVEGWHGVRAFEITLERQGFGILDEDT